MATATAARAREAPRVTLVALAGRAQLVRALQLAFGALVAGALLQAALYARPSPYGGPFLAEWPRYLPFALYYEMLGTWLLALPFLAFWLARWRRPVRAGTAAALQALLAGLLAAGLVLGQLDHELLRFLGVRLNFSFLAAYARPEMLGDRLFVDLLASDRGGPFGSIVLLLLIPAAYLAWASRRLRAPAPGFAPGRWLALLLVLAPIVVPAQAWLRATGQFRLRKVEPVVIALAVDAKAGFEDRSAPADLDAMVADYRRGWLARSTDPGWHFADADYPYLRVPAAPALPTGTRWNVIYLQLETFRGADMGHLRPDRWRSPAMSPTPRLDRLAARPDAAVWTRTSSFGMPSLNGLFASHCSVAPPSQRYISGYTHVALLCLPALLRRHGWRTEMFNGGDTDWDNSSPWLNAWYDRLQRFPAAEQRDREVFRAATPEIVRLGRSGRPFFAAIVSVTNHTPFRSREPALDIAGDATPGEAILNTTHYTDDVVGDFLDRLAGEPWLDRTLIVVTGDHGYSVGEHGGRPGRQDLYRESLWVPLIIAGPHPRLRPGRHDVPASLLDVAPTLADLLGFRVANPWQGGSLLAVNGGGVLAFGFRSALVAETAAWSAVRDPQDGAMRLYDARRDWLQRRDLSGRAPARARALLDQAERSRRRHDHLLRRDRIWPRTRA